MKLVEPFAYIDPKGLSWDAPVGSVVDGALDSSAVDEQLAKVMYGAVYQFGPRWSLSVRQVVPLTDVDDTLSRYRAIAKPGEVVATNMTPIPRGMICDAAGNCTFIAVPKASDPVNAFVFAEYQPTPSALKVSDFDKLKAFIETTNPPLAAIENYRP